MILFVLHDPGDYLDESIESFHQRFSLCEWPIKYDGNEHLSSIFLMRAGLPACIYSRIATALFSQRFRSHSSIVTGALLPTHLTQVLSQIPSDLVALLPSFFPFSPPCLI